MRSPALAAILILALTAVCVRLGFWQIDRWHEKRRLNDATKTALATPVLDLGRESASFETVRGHRVAVRGRFDEGRQILLSYRTHDGAPGVEVVTPLVLTDGRRAVLVNRGWLYAADGATARPQDYPEPGYRAAVGLPVALTSAVARGQPASRASLRLLTTDSLTLWSTRWLDPDTLARRLPYALAPWMLRQLPGARVPFRPLRAAPRPLDEWTHVSYAVQWFLFGSILLGGSAALAWTRGRRAAMATGARSASEADPELHRRG